MGFWKDLTKALESLARPSHYDNWSSAGSWKPPANKNNNLKAGAPKASRLKRQSGEKSAPREE